MLIQVVSTLIYLHRFDTVFMMEYPDDLNPKSMITGFISYVDELLIHCLQVSCIQTNPHTKQKLKDIHTTYVHAYIHRLKQVDVVPSKNQALCCKLNLLIYRH